MPKKLHKATIILSDTPEGGLDVLVIMSRKQRKRQTKSLAEIVAFETVTTIDDTFKEHGGYECEVEVV